MNKDQLKKLEADLWSADDLRPAPDFQALWQAHLAEFAAVQAHKGIGGC